MDFKKYTTYKINYLKQYSEFQVTLIEGALDSRNVVKLDEFYAFFRHKKISDVDSSGFFGIYTFSSEGVTFKFKVENAPNELNIIISIVLRLLAAQVDPVTAEFYFIERFWGVGDTYNRFFCANQKCDIVLDSLIVDERRSTEVQNSVFSFHRTKNQDQEAKVLLLYKLFYSRTTVGVHSSILQQLNYDLTKDQILHPEISINEKLLKIIKIQEYLIKIVVFSALCVGYLTFR